MTTQERIAEIRKRLNKASPGPWRYDSYNDVCSEPLLHKLVTDHDESYEETYDESDHVCSVPAKHGTQAVGRHADDALFIAESPTDIAWLLGRLALADKLADAAANVFDVSDLDEALSVLAGAFNAYRGHDAGTGD